MMMIWSNRNNDNVFLALIVWFIYQHSAQSEMIFDIPAVANTVMKEHRSNSTSNFRRPSSSPYQSATDYHTIIPKDSPRQHTNDRSSIASIRSSSSVRAQHSGRMSIMNMTCKFFKQPLNHFVPRGKSPYYQQRYCYYDEYAKIKVDDDVPAINSPIFFYTGNESPLEQYINQVRSSQ